MKVKDHLMRIENIEQTMQNKLDRNVDYELYVECCMLAGTQALNLILHEMQITDQSWDLLHTHKPVLEAQVPKELKPLFEGLKFIEDIRPDYLRGVKQWNPEDGEICLRNYKAIKSFAEQLLSSKKTSA